ncbi:hypothetical protein [Streptacidiphilus jiangxiensis]|uniref:Type II toxin-antitoxin system RelE/ParE family toxin n=1 Tax=Streptacidiphilus jiangxiensis TaxID=235985 RepID=A0A1H7ZM41_STRJI|nr:hypothetical protein [Streptacidiphilus jiangxiensis]SEM59333.1 hypothetical protein SAMN05414137_13625 [Streptacidiphilus jiangxiensis]
MSLPPRWTVAASEHAADTLQAVLKSGDERLYRAVLLFLRGAALELGSALAAGHRPPGLRLDDGRIALDVPREPVVVYYLADTARRELFVTDVIWLG